MKTKRGLIFISLIALAIIAWWLRERYPVNTEIQSLDTNNTPTVMQTNLSNDVASPVSKPVSLAENVTTEAKREWQMHEASEQSKDEWRTPIDFYGKVVDQSNAPVQDAHVDFSCNDLSSSGTSEYHGKSDGTGLFSLIGIKGKLLTVKIMKDGYYTSGRDTDSFYYAGQNVNFVPNSANPIIFHLRKRASAEQLIHVQATLGGGKGFKIAKDGTPLTISLTSGMAVPAGQGDVEVQCWTDDQGKAPGQKYDWKCRIVVPGGGILQYSDEFPFQAPLDGYQPSDEIKMPASMDTEWGHSAKRNYFLRLANGNYARMSFEMVAGGDHFFKVESFLNPSGSRNLEFNPAAQ